MRMRYRLREALWERARNWIWQRLPVIAVSEKADILWKLKNQLLNWNQNYLNVHHARIRAKGIELDGNAVRFWIVLSRIRWHSSLPICSLSSSAYAPSTAWNPVMYWVYSPVSFSLQGFFIFPKVVHMKKPTRNEESVTWRQAFVKAVQSRGKRQKNRFKKAESEW